MCWVRGRLLCFLQLCHLLREGNAASPCKPSLTLAVCDRCAQRAFPLLGANPVPTSDLHGEKAAPALGIKAKSFVAGVTRSALKIHLPLLSYVLLHVSA